MSVFSLAIRTSLSEKNEANLSVWCRSGFVLHSEAHEAPLLISMLSWWTRQEIISALCTGLHTDHWGSCCLRDTVTPHPPAAHRHMTSDVSLGAPSLWLCLSVVVCGPSLLFFLSRFGFTLFFIRFFFVSVVSVEQWFPCRWFPEAPPWLCCFSLLLNRCLCLLLSVASLSQPVLQKPPDYKEK